MIISMRGESRSWCEDRGVNGWKDGVGWSEEEGQAQS